MIRREAIEIISKNTISSIVSANGYISRDLFDVADKASNFYMIGSMGLSSSIGLGIAIKAPKKRVYVLDGDGNILMNLGSLTTIGALRPKNLVHIVLDNGSHESTGGQPTHSRKIRIDSMARATNYTVFKTSSKGDLKRIMEKIENIPGPIFILVNVKKNTHVSKRVSLSPSKIRDRFMNSL